MSAQKGKFALNSAVLLVSSLAKTGPNATFSAPQPLQTHYKQSKSHHFFSFEQKQWVY